jgi:hypothetical protein
MPTYRIEFSLQTSLQFDKDVILEHQGHSVTFLLPATGNARIRVDIDGANNQQAQLRASSAIIPPVLDALAFSTGTPLLLMHCCLVLKSEAGSSRRRLIYCENVRQSLPARLTNNAVEDAQRILSTENGPDLPLCWHRYAIQRSLALDKFVFQWLAFESLAGKKQIPTTCPRCGAHVTHCELNLLHEGSNRENAYALFSRAELATSFKEFTRDIWGTIRNSVFHGTKYPSPDFLLQLNSLWPKLRRACDSEFNARYGFREQERPVRNTESYLYKFNFLEWQTKTPENNFASDFPWVAFHRSVEKMGVGDLRINAPEVSGFSFVDYRRESPNW